MHVGLHRHASSDDYMWLARPQVLSPHLKAALKYFPILCNIERIRSPLASQNLLNCNTYTFRLVMATSSAYL